MAIHTNDVKRKTPGHGVLAAGVAGVILVVLFVFYWRSLDLLPPQRRGPSLPDISKCTRVELEYGSQIADGFSSLEPSVVVLSDAEMDYVKSLRNILFDDPQTIKALAGVVDSAAYSGHHGGHARSRSATRAHMVCYRNGEPAVCLTVVAPDAIEDDAGRIFICEDVMHKILRLPPLLSRLEPLNMRISCAIRMLDLHSEFRYPPESPTVYPPPDRWCDEIADGLRRSHVKREALRQSFSCPNVGGSRCNYAMNPNSGYDSPPDTVLLFETRPGWNQHGGRELFTFDNHDPRGGLVLLNDGTVKFIRTEEELRELRWK